MADINSRGKLWDRWRENAISVLERDIEDMSHKTLDPTLCLLEDDKEMMRERQQLIEQWRSNVAAIRGNTLWGKMLVVPLVAVGSIEKLLSRRNGPS